jgi:hypothetical protein
MSKYVSCFDIKKLKIQAFFFYGYLIAFVPILMHYIHMRLNNVARIKFGTLMIILPI